MQTLEVEPAKLDYQQYVKRSALESDAPLLVKEETLLVFRGVPLAYYGFLPRRAEKLVAKLRQIKYETTERTGGLKTTSRVFGYQPRVALRRDFCSATRLATEDPSASAMLAEFGEDLDKLYATIIPNVHERHVAELQKKIKPEWRMARTAFTSGIVNKNNPLKYHFDSGNFKGVCSCMLGFKRNVAGGHLAIPELGVSFEIADHSVAIFDGQSLLHGVTPIKALTADAYRFTVVYYALESMWRCEPLELELARIRNVKTERENKRTKEVVVDQHGEREIEQGA